MEVISANPKLAGIDLEKILTPAALLRPEAAQRCVQKQVLEGACGVPPLWASAAAQLPHHGVLSTVQRSATLQHRDAPNGALASFMSCHPTRPCMGRKLISLRATSTPSSLGSQRRRAQTRKPIMQRGPGVPWRR